MPCTISVLVQQCSSISNPAARMIRAAVMLYLVLNSRFKCSSGAWEEIEGVMEISNNKSKFQQVDYSSNT